MSSVLFIRHGPTAWNAEGRMQGRTDVPLSAAARGALAARSLPDEFADYDWVASPLVRAVETAWLLGARGLRLEPRIAELHWGRWEGRTRAALREQYGQPLVENEHRGLDFRPLGGECAREMRARLRTWFVDVLASERPVIAVTHKGVIQMALAIATGWDLVSRAPQRLDWERAHLFGLSGAAAQPRPVRLNIGLAET